MGLLDHLWDDTLAGPPPENGLGKLRKYCTFSSRSSAGKESGIGSTKSLSEDGGDEPIRVTRKIMIVKPPGYQSGSPPVSPAGTGSPGSPFSGKGRSLFGSGADLHQMPSRQVEIEALPLLLMMCDV